MERRRLSEQDRHLYNVIGVLMFMLGIALGVGLFKMWYGLW